MTQKPVTLKKKKNTHTHTHTHLFGPPPKPGFTWSTLFNRCPERPGSSGVPPVAARVTCSGAVLSGRAPSNGATGRPEGSLRVRRTDGVREERDGRIKRAWLFPTPSYIRAQKTDRDLTTWELLRNHQVLHVLFPFVGVGPLERNRPFSGSQAEIHSKHSTSNKKTPKTRPVAHPGPAPGAIPARACNARIGGTTFVETARGG